MQYGGIEIQDTQCRSALGLITNVDVSNIPDIITIEQNVNNALLNTIPELTSRISLLESNYNMANKILLERVNYVDNTALEFGKYYTFSSSLTTVDFTLPTITDSMLNTNIDTPNNKLYNTILSFTTGTSCNVIFSIGTTPEESNISIFTDDQFSIEDETTYEINILFDGSKFIISHITMTSYSAS